MPRQKKPKAGLGDVIKSVTDALGIPQCDKCKERQATLNRLFPFTKTQEFTELTERELQILDDMDKTKILKQEYVKEFFQAYNVRFVRNPAHYIIPCQCPGVVKSLKEKLDLLKKY